MAKSLVCGHEYEHDGWPKDEACPDCFCANAEAELDQQWGMGEEELDLRTVRRLAAADALAVAGKDAVKFLAKYVADTESVLAQRALDRMEATLRQYEAAK